MKLAFVIVNFHSDEDSLSIIRDLLTNDPVKDVEVYIYAVDNSRSHNFKEALKDKQRVIYVDSPYGNVGFAGGNNLGMKKALADKADIICLINNDTQAPKDLVKNIINSPISDPKIGVVGGLIYFAKGFEFKKGYKPDEKGRVIWFAGGNFDWDNILGSNDNVDVIDNGQFKQNIDTEVVTGALFITKAEVLGKVGLFDEKYFMYLEDMDLCQRIVKSGYHLMVDPQIKIWHKVAQSSGIGSDLNDYFITRNRLLFGFKYAKLRTKFALLREAVKFIVSGRPPQKQGVKDFFMGRFGKGTWLK